MPPSSKTLIDICLFKAKPQDLPASNQLLVSVIFCASVLVLWSNFYLIGGGKSIAISAMQLFLVGLSLNVLLIIFDQSARWVQSATAMYGSWCFFTVLFLPFVMFDIISLENINQPGLQMLLLTGFTIWNFMVMVRIYKETLEVSTGTGILIGFTVTMIFRFVMFIMLNQGRY